MADPVGDERNRGVNVAQHSLGIGPILSGLVVTVHRMRWFHQRVGLARLHRLDVQVDVQHQKDVDGRGRKRGHALEDGTNFDRALARHRLDVHEVVAWLVQAERGLQERAHTGVVVTQPGWDASDVRLRSAIYRLVWLIVG